MGIRLKIFLIFFGFGIVPLLALGFFNYWSGVGAVEAALRTDVERDAAAIVSDAQTRQRESEAELTTLARLPSLRAYLNADKQPQPSSPASSSAAPAASNASITTPVPEALRADLDAFLRANQKYYRDITCLNTERKVVLRAEPDTRNPDGHAARIQTQDFINPAGPDERVWTINEQRNLRGLPQRDASGLIVRYTVPVFIREESSVAMRGALIVDLKLDTLFADSASALSNALGSVSQRALEPPASRLIVALDGQGNIIYHTNDALRYQPVMTAMPAFKRVADSMLGEGAGGWKFYDSPEGPRWLVAYLPASAMNLTVAVAVNYSQATEGFKRRGATGLILSVLVGLVAAYILALVVGRTARSIERVTEGAVAIAGGRLDQRIEVRSSDETRVLAESFNIMTDRLRERIALEAEMRQFQSFLRLSAMLTHDLKNAIAALSLVVRNMERQFHREEFRADAMESLTAATDKLRNLVTKLSGPVESLSGEHQRPRPVNLVPVIRRVLKTTAEPTGSLHQIEAHLPESLIAAVDEERIERVLENLIINALEAMGAQSGRLTIQAGRAAPGKIFFSVCDTGPGISEEYQRTRLFHAFATTKNKGVGLGLYTCREIIKAHGGQIEVQSDEGSGTCFRVVLPSGPDHAATG